MTAPDMAPETSEATLRADIELARAHYHGLVTAHAAVTTELAEASRDVEAAQESLMAWMARSVEKCATCGQTPVVLLKTPGFHTQKYRETPAGVKYAAEKTWTPPVYEAGCPWCTRTLTVVPTDEALAADPALAPFDVQVPTENGRGSTREEAIRAFNDLQAIAAATP